MGYSLELSGPPVWSCDISVGSRRQVAGISVWLLPVASSGALSRLLVLLYRSFLISNHGHMGEIVEVSEDFMHFFCVHLIASLAVRVRPLKSRSGPGIPGRSDTSHFWSRAFTGSHEFPVLSSPDSVALKTTCGNGHIKMWQRLHQLSSLSDFVQLRLLST